MNPEMMRQMIERLAAQRAGVQGDVEYGDYVRRAQERGPGNVELNDILRRVQERGAQGLPDDYVRRGQVPEGRGLPDDYVRRGQVPEGRDSDITNNRRLGQVMEYEGDDPELQRYRQMMEESMENRRTGNIPREPVLPRSTADNMDRAMADRAREMALRAAMRRILTSEDIPPSPTR